MLREAPSRRQQQSRVVCVGAGWLRCRSRWRLGDTLPSNGHLHDEQDEQGTGQNSVADARHSADIRAHGASAAGNNSPKPKFARGARGSRRNILEKKIAGLLGAVAALGTISSAQAAPAPAPVEVLQANSYAELLEPIPNAAATLQALDERQAAGGGEARVQLAQYHHHHHHHHHHWRRRPIVVVPPHRRHHHHHHHHHHY